MQARNTDFLFLNCQTLGSSLVLSRLDYCNALHAGSPQVLLDKIQRVISCSARLIFKVPKSAHVTPFLYDLHWLPISSRIQYKIALICFHIVSGTAPYLFISTLLLAVFAQPRILTSSVFLGWAEGPGGEILSIHWTCALELPSSLCQAFFTLFF